MRLHRLTGLEQDKIRKEYIEVLDRIEDLLEILQSPGRLKHEIQEELTAVRDQYGNERRTEILQSRIDLSTEDLIEEEDVVVTLSHEGYIKSQPLGDYRAQRRGGKGKMATRTKQEDFVDKLFVVNTHDTILCFSSNGKVYWLKVYEIPQSGRGARGKPIVNLLPLSAQEQINAILPVRGFAEGMYVFMATSDGTVKKTALTEFSRPRASGIIAVNLESGNKLIGVELTNGQSDIILFSDGGKVVRFDEKDVRVMGRTAKGVRGIELRDKQAVVSLIIVPPGMAEETSVLTATSNGYGKRTLLTDYPTRGRGGRGVISIQANSRNGKVVSACLTNESTEVMLISNGGTLIRMYTNEISTMGRNTQGVRLIELNEDEILVGLDIVAETQEDATSSDI
jgi:DNA gyrase subunit A